MTSVNRWAMLVLGVCMAVALQCAEATNYTVGDSTGWTVPPGNQLYSSWAANKTFKVGDTLFFAFTTNVHNVFEVTKANYDSCSSTSSLRNYTTGPATVPLTTAGAQYYICTVGTHCSSGQKLTITVSAASATSPTTSPSPSPSPSPSSSSSPPSSTPTPSPSSSPSPSASSPSPSGPSAPAESPTGSPPPASPTGSSPESPTTPGATTSGPPSSSPPESPSSASYPSTSPPTVWMGMLFGVAAVFFSL